MSNSLKELAKQKRKELSDLSEQEKNLKRKSECYYYEVLLKLIFELCYIKLMCLRFCLRLFH